MIWKVTGRFQKYYQIRIFQTNINMIQAVGTECKLDSSVSALHFSPDGRFLAAATSKGIIHLLDVETGKVRFSVK